MARDGRFVDDYPSGGLPAGTVLTRIELRRRR
jgi:hypothetical protein